ncbi:type VI secretion system membrane subunit TssM [Meridianimarinicoccus roseus]|uniref:Type VI secretion system membrane subunit TssM n=1 Tax=Meridianimarinicoccus roseus TaxID=2072018 RepID=A0A2V2L759_9RHOB|nr:type VI secretion system membrane subunit TssM [Meridianimarinicoccus roseus]PWR01182.1 type VI secretion system membrane subunit TssM [Meridianimarinicoccus roseus]
MGKVLRALGSSIGITMIVALSLSLCIWFLGGFLGIGDARPLESVAGRLVGLGILWIVALIIVLILLLTSRKRDAALTEEIVTAADTAGPDDGVLKAELDEMRGKLRAAMVTLRKSKAGRGHLYELPWYVIIGPPGAGKTTAIVNSGLQFPLAGDMGKAAVGGVGGTRNCDWWFTDNAVLVDTAGRYTTHESDSEADNAAWLGFLGILKKYRKRQPINGAIVAISLSDLSMQDEQTQRNHAAAIRRRLSELQEKLGVRFPVYVLFTKADLLAGFIEFFDPLGKEARGQVWGFTFPLKPAKDSGGPLAGFDTEYGALLDRLNAQSLDRMQAESDAQKRSLIAGFPAQVASVRQVAHDFLTELFQESRLDHAPLLRGVYFTSGTQEGSPIDRLMMGMARTFGIGRQAIGSGSGSGRSYFLTHLFDRVVFRESGLVSADDRVERRYRWAKRGAIAATLLIAAGMGTAWTRSYMGNTQLIANVADQTARYEQAAALIPPSPVGDTDLPSIVPALDLLRALPVNPVDGAVPAPAGLGWGLYQGQVIGTQAEQAYRAALNEYLLPRLLLRLEEQMQSNINNPDLLYEALKVYLMLGLIGPMNAELVTQWMEVDWLLAYPGPQRADLRAALSDHLAAMLSQPMDQITLNNDLVTQVQTVLARMPQAQRVYNGIINSNAATDLPQFRLTDVGGPSLSRAFVRSTNAPLNEGIPGIYTYDGFNGVFLAEALSVAERIQRDAWVLGEQNAIEQTDAALAALSRDVLDLYYNDFIAQYDKLLAELDIIPLVSLSHAVEVTNVLSGPTSPIVNILTAVSQETQLTRVPEEETAEGGVSGDQAAAAGKLAAKTLKIKPKLSPAATKLLRTMNAAGGGSGEVPDQPGEYVEDRFAWLHELVASQDGQPSQLDLMMQSLTLVYQELNKLNFAGGLGTPSTEVSALAQFQADAARLPGPMQRWAQQIALGSSGITADTTRAGLNAQWQSGVLPMCSQATGNAYPFDRRAAADISLADFTRLFGPGGLIDSFFTQNLAEYVDIRTRPWSWKTAGGGDLGISASVLQQFQYAAEIRDAFFAGGPAAGVQFQITPEALDPGAEAIILEIDGQTIAFQNTDGQPRPTAVTWPGTVGLARVTFLPPRAGSESTLNRDGPWGLFRLLDAAEIRDTSASDRKRIIFNIGGRIAIFQMQAGSVLNPFALPALTAFSCPETF